MSLASRRFVRIAAPTTIAAMLASMVLGSPAGAAHSPVGLGTATSFAVLAGSGITNDIAGTVITGDVGSFPTTTISNTGNWTLVPPSVNQGGNAVTQGAKTDLQTAFDDAKSRLPEIAQDAELGGEIKAPGVYAGGAVGLNGQLTLAFGNDVDALFVFKMASTLDTFAGSSVVMTGAAADACRVVWVVGSSATFGTNSTFVGDVLAHTSISANTGASFQGRLLALNGAVTLLDNTINKGNCATVAPTATTTTTTTTAAPVVFVPTPVTSTTTTSTTSTTVRRTTTTTRPPTTTTTSTTSTTPPKDVATTDATPPTPTPTPTPTTIDPSVTGQGQQTPPTPPGTPGTPTATPTTPGTPTGVPELPRTGSGTLALAITGAGLVVLGSAAVRIERRARSAQLV